MKLNNLTAINYRRDVHDIVATVQACSTEEVIRELSSQPELRITTDNEALPQLVDTLMGYNYLHDVADNGDGTYTVRLTDQEPTTEDVQQAVLDTIREYDQSEAVNRFSLQGQPMWLDAETRTKLARRLDTEEQDGLEETNLWYEARCYHLPIARVRQMLHQLEAYAIRCYDQTQWHISNVLAMTDPEQMQAYDYTRGYPEQPAFD